MLNFTVGPVQTSEMICSIGAEQVPYFRTQEFSNLMLENEMLIKHMAKADAEARAVFLTGSGTAAMEATVINVFDKQDKVLVINGGSFGDRFVRLCNLHGVQYTEIKLAYGQNLTCEILSEYDPSDYSGLLVNALETSTGVHYDLAMLSKFCKKNNLLFVVDAISSFIADEINMSELGIDVMIIGSQKALACPPGISVILLSKKAIERIMRNVPCCMYFDLRDALKNGERGQTPFTPAVGILRQIHARLKEIEKSGGIKAETERIAALALDFRKKIWGLPFDLFSSSMSNAVTALTPRNVSAYDIFLQLKDNYGIWVCPNGGELADKVFRVGHIGALTKEDNDILVAAFVDLQNKGLL